MQLLSADSDIFGLTELSGDVLVVLEASVELELQLLLRHLYKEVTNLLRDNISKVSQTEDKVVIDTASDLSNKDILASLLVGYKVTVLSTIVVLRLLVRQRLAIRAILDVLRLVLHLVLVLGNDIGSVFLIAVIVSKQIILLSINDSFHDSTCVVTLFGEHAYYNIHKFRDESRESLEDLVNDVMSKGFKLTVDILQQLHGRFSQLIKLRLKQVVENVN